MFENNNLKGLLNQISSGAMDKVQSALNDPNSRAEIDEQMFQSALQGIRDGVMEYKNDPLLPILNDEINTRTEAFKGLSAAEESNLLQLSAEQKRIITENDKATKAEFLSTVPKLGHPGLKLSDKYISFTNSIGAH